jgi:hypothetical protein
MAIHSLGRSRRGHVGAVATPAHLIEELERRKARKKEPFDQEVEDGSDGTRTRDLRRDRPRKGSNDPPRDDPEEPD